MQMRHHADKMFERKGETDLVNSAARAVVPEVKAKLRWILGCRMGAAFSYLTHRGSLAKARPPTKKHGKGEEKLLWLGQFVGVHSGGSAEELDAIFFKAGRT